MKYYGETFLGVPASGSSDKKDSLIDLDDQAAGGDADMLNTKFSAMCKFQCNSLFSSSVKMNLNFSATSQLSKIKSTPAKVDEFDMLAQSRKGNDGKTAVSKELEVDLLSGQTNAKPQDFDEIEEWLRAEKSGVNPNDGEDSLTSKEFDKFLAERAAVAETLPNISSESRPKKKQEEPLLG